MPSYTATFLFIQDDCHKVTSMHVAFHIASAVSAAAGLRRALVRPNGFTGTLFLQPSTDYRKALSDVAVVRPSACAHTHFLQAERGDPHQLHTNHNVVEALATPPRSHIGSQIIYTAARLAPASRPTTHLNPIFARHFSIVACSRSFVPISALFSVPGIFKRRSSRPATFC